MIKAIENIKNDIARIQNIFDQDPLSALIGLLLIVSALSFIFYFVVIQKILL